MSRAALGALAFALLAGGCGKVGPVRAPGPPEDITYPRQYPAPETRPGESAAPPAAPASAPPPMPTIIRQ